MNQPTPDVAPFRYYVQMVLPAVYGDELSYYEVLAKVTEKLNEVIENLNKQGQNVNDLMVFYNQLKAQVDALENEVDAIKNGEYVHLYLDSIINWIDANLQCLVSRIVKFVCFGLGDDGHFKAYIPATWQFLQFDTGMNPDDSETYGHLIIKW